MSFDKFAFGGLILAFIVGMLVIFAGMWMDYYAPKNCHDEFIASDSWSSNREKCPAGTTMEVVKEPKPGWMCRCPKSPMMDGGQ